MFVNLRYGFIKSVNTLLQEYNKWKDLSENIEEEYQKSQTTIKEREVYGLSSFPHEIRSLFLFKEVLELSIIKFSGFPCW